MKTVYKYDVPFGDEALVEMPAGAELLTAADQSPDDLFPDIKVWARVEPGRARVKRRFYLRGTGHDAPVDAPWVASVVGRQFVWHVFDGGEEA